MEEIVNELEKIAGKDWIITDPELVKGHLEDETPKGAKMIPATGNIVVKPGSAAEISQVLKAAARLKTPVFIRGGATGLVCGCVPTKRGIILSMERLKNIEIDSETLTATVGAGVTLGELIEAAGSEKLSFPPHPGDEAAQVGGLIACNAGGARAVKTGVVRNFVMGLEVVLPSGEVINTGGKLVKDNVSAGKLMHLFIGTEGIFGIITKAVLKLLPAGKATATVVIPFENKHDALGIVPKILKCGTTPQGLEYVEKRTIELATDKWVCEEGNVFLILMFEESSEEALYGGLESLSVLLDGTSEPRVADSPSQQERILRIRSELFGALKPDMYGDLDVCVPVNKLNELLSEIDRVSEKYDTYLHPYGHAGDGNIHVHVMEKTGWKKERYDALIEEIYKAGNELGGVITGEHGIGEAKKQFLYLNLDGESHEVLRRIKIALDPDNILNPGKVIDI